MKKILPIVLFNFICLSSMMFILPVIGPIVRKLSLSEWHSGLIVGISGVFWMLFSRFWGKRSDNYGRRNTLIIATSGYCLSFFALSFFIDSALSSAWKVSVILLVFIILRSFVGAFYAAIPTVCSARMADVTSVENRTTGMAILGASSGIAMISGPVLSGILSQKSLTLPLYVASALPLIALFLLFFFFPKQKHQPTKQMVIKLSDPRLRLPILTGLLSSSCVYSANVCIGFYGLDVLHLSEKGAAEVSGYAMGAVGVSMIVAQVFMTRFKSIKPIQWLMIGSVVGAVGFSLVTLLDSKEGLYISYAVAALGIGWLFPAMQTLASQAVGEDEQGIAAGSVTAAQGLAMVISPIVSTLLYQVNPLLPYWFATGLLGVLFIIVLKQRNNTTVRA